MIAAKRLGAEQIIILGRHPAADRVGKAFGATDVVSERGEEAVERVRKLTGGHGVHSVLECVGNEQAMLTAVDIAAPGRRRWSRRSSSLSGNRCVGAAPTRAYMAELLPDVLEGRIDPGRAFDRTVGINEVSDGYRAMDKREAIKVMVKP